MDSHPANSFFTNFTSLFNRIEKTKDTPVLSSFHSLSEKTTELQNISAQNPHNIILDNDSPVKNDLKAMDVSSQINSRTTSETEVLIETEAVLAKTIQPRDECNNHNDLGQRSSLEQIRDNNFETHINISTDQDEATIPETPSHTGKEFLGMDLKVSIDQGNSWKDSSLACDQRVTDGQPDLLSLTFSQEHSNDRLSNTAPAESHRSGDLSGCISKQTAEELPDKVMRDGNTTNITKGEVLSTLQHEDKYQEWTNEVKHMQTKTQESSFMSTNEELYPESTSQTSSNDINDPISTVAVSDQADEAMSTFKNNLDQNCGQDRGTMMKDESEDQSKLVQIEGGEKESVMKEENKDILQEDSNSASLGIPSTPRNQEEPPNTENVLKPTRRVTFSPVLKLEKPPQLPSIFSGLKGLKKEVHDQQKNALPHEEPKSPSLMKQASIKRALFAEKHSKSEFKGSILEQLSQLLSFDAGKIGAKKTPEPTASPPLSPSSEAPVAEMPPVEECVKGPDVASSEESSKLTNTDTALNAFKAFFTPKPIKRDTSDHIDIDAVKRAFNPETIRAIFDRNSSKSPDNKNIFDKKSSESEERTPGRLQAIWPPPKPKDKEEKIGLKYTEAEHQAALLHLKRECKEEVEALEADFKLQFYQLREEKEETVSRLQAEISDLKKAAKSSRGELRDVAVSTEDNFTPRIFRNVCIQTDRETFIKPVEELELSKDLCPQPNVPKKLDLASISRNLAGKQEPALSPLLPLPPPPPVSEFDGVTTSKPSPSLPSPSECYSKPAQPDKCPPLTQGNGPPPPPPPPPPTIRAGLSPPPPLPGPVPSLPTGGELFLFKAQERPQRKPRVEPVCPMKPLYWTRIQIQDSRNDTLWTSLKEPAIINTNEFAELFSKMSSPAKKKPLSEAYDKTAKAKKIIKVLDSKRSQAVGILISSLHLELKDIQQAILMMDNSVVDLDAIEALYENRAQPEELAAIRKHYETSDEEHVKLLDKPEQFLYELSLIPQFSLRARCIILQSTFTDAVASIQRKTNIVLQVCKDLLERDSVKDVMGLVLSFGNYMNGGSRHRGQADGFGLDILPKLKDVKSRDNRISLVDYVVSYYLRNLDENAGTENCVFPLPEPQDVFLASQVKFEDLSKELRKLGKDLEGCEKDVQRVWLTSSQEYINPFREKMEAFISSAQKEQKATEHHVMSAQKSFHDLVQYFGMKPRSGEQDVLPGHVFMLWFEFCNDFKTRWKRENKAISNERLKEAQQSVRNITADKKVETRQVHANGLKERLRQKEASISST